MIVGILACSMLFGSGAFGPRSADDVRIGAPAVNIPREMANAEEDAAMIDREYSRAISITSRGEFYIGNPQYPLDAMPDVLARQLKTTSPSSSI